MLNRSRLMLAAMTAALALTLGAATSNAARSFSATNNTSLTYVSPGLTFNGSGGNQIICKLTLTASVHASAAKARGSLMGFVNGGRLEGCSNSVGGTTTAIALVGHRNPWHITGETFTGTLPRITGMTFTLNRARFLEAIVEPLFNRVQGCLFSGNIRVNTRGRTGAAEYTVETYIGDSEILTLFEDRLNESIAECVESGSFVGTFHATLPAVIRLI